MGHADHRRHLAGIGGQREDLVENRNRTLGTFEAKTLGADVLGGEELLESFGRIETFDETALLFLGQLEVDTLEVRLDPALLIGVLDVHVLHTDGAAVRVTKNSEEVAQRHAIATGHTARARHGAGQEFTVEIPDGEAVGGRVEFDRHLRLFPAQRVDVGDEVSTDAMNADQGGDLHLLLQTRFVAVERIDVGTPLDRLVRNAEALEDVLVETVLTEQQLVHPLEEQAALGALDDAMVVRTRDRDDLRHTEGSEGALVGALEFGRIVDAADSDDDTLAGHQTRNALNRSDGARVGDADGGTLEIGHLQLVLLDLANELVVGHHELGEVERVGVTQNWHDERATSVGLGHVDREPHVHVCVAHHSRLTVGPLDERRVHDRYGVGDGANDGVSDDVGERDLVLTRTRAVPVDDLAVDLEQLGRNVAEAGGGGDRQAAFHVGDDGDTGSLDGFAERIGGRQHWCGCRTGTGCAVGRCAVTRGCGRHRSGGHRGRGRSRWCSSDFGARLVIGKELSPGLADRGRVEPVLLEHLLDEPAIGSEVGRAVGSAGNGVGHIGNCTPADLR